VYKALGTEQAENNTSYILLLSSIKLGIKKESVSQGYYDDEVKVIYRECL
jgi:hypothetical protein